MFDENELIERIQTINKEMEQCKANHAKLEGHLQESMHWLGKIRKEQLDFVEECQSIDPDIESPGSENDEINDKSAE